MLNHIQSGPSPRRSLNRWLCAALTAVLLAGAGTSLQAAATNEAAANPATDELKALVTKIQTKLRSGQRTEAALADEMKQFDALLAKHKDEKTDATAQIALMRAMLYLEVFKQPTKAAEYVQQLKQDYPDTRPGRDADRVLDFIKQQAEAEQVQAALAVGKPFPDFQETDVAGKPLSVAKVKGPGKVVLIDFWATWCGPCVHELPNVLKTYEKHHGAGFEIIGISLDQDKEKLLAFTESHKMPWPQYFDGKGWQNKLAGKYGVRSIPATFLLDGEGKIIGRDLRGDALETAVAKALSAK